MAYNTFTLTGTYKHLDGTTPAEGVIEIIPSEKVIKDTTGNVILSGRLKPTLDANGAFSVTLPDPRDATNLNPAGFGYTVVAKLRHQHLAAVSFGGDQITAEGSVLGGVTTLDIENVTPAPESTFVATATYVEAADLAALETTVAGKVDTQTRGTRRDRKPAPPNVLRDYFEVVTVGEQPPGWTHGGEASGTFTVQPVTTTNRAVAGRQLRVSGLAVNTPTGLLSDDFGVHADGEILTLMARGSGSARTGIVLRANDAMTNFYALEFLPSTVTLGKRVNGSWTQLAAVAANITTNDRVWLRLRVEGTSVKGKWWFDSVAEPAAWTWEVTDTSHTTGKGGVYQQTTGSDGYWYNIAFGFDGESAPYPNDHLTVLEDLAAFDTVYHTGGGAVYDEVSNRTYVAFLGVERRLFVTAWDHTTGTQIAPVEVRAYPMSTSDNHGGPSIALDRAGHLVVVFGAHNDIEHHVMRSPEPRSLAGTWTDTAIHNGTYARVVLDPASGDLFIFDRAGTGHGTVYPTHEFYSCCWSADGLTWTDPLPILNTNDTPEATSDPYVSDVVTGPDGRMWLIMSIARGASHDGDRIGIYALLFDPDGETVYAPDGVTSLGPTATFADLEAHCLLVEAPHAESERRIEFDTDGNPWIAFADYESDADTVGRVRVVHREAGAWLVETVTTIYWDKTIGAAPADGGPAVDLRFRNDDGTLDLFVAGKRNNLEPVRCERWNLDVGSDGVWARQETVAWGLLGTQGAYRTQVPQNSRDDFPVMLQCSSTSPPGNPLADGTDTTPLYAWINELPGD